MNFFKRLQKPLLQISLLLWSSLAFAVPQDYINQDGDMWLLHTFSESEAGYIENIFEISAMRLRCVAQFFTEDHDIEYKTEEFSRIISHHFTTPLQSAPVGIVSRRHTVDTVSALPPPAPLTETNLARLQSLHRRAPARSSMIAAQGSTPPSARISPAQSPPESRRGSFPASAAASTHLSGSSNSSRRSTLTLQSVATSDGLPDFR